MEKRGAKPQKQVSTEWSPKLAYAVGLIATDGCLSKDGRHIDFTSKDQDLISTFRECLGLKNKIGTKRSGFTCKKEYYRLQFGDVSFYNWLCVVGLSPHKSKTLGELIIPDKFFFDFLRGCFDGDGTIFAYWDKRWHSSYMYYVAFASASIDYLEWLQRTIFKLLNINGKIRGSNKICYQLAFAKQGSRILFNKMFY